jgi:hypothetical protein
VEVPFAEKRERKEVKDIRRRSPSAFVEAALNSERIRQYANHRAATHEADSNDGLIPMAKGDRQVRHQVHAGGRRIPVAIRKLLDARHDFGSPESRILDSCDAASALNSGVLIRKTFFSVNLSKSSSASRSIRSRAS